MSLSAALLILSVTAGVTALPHQKRATLQWRPCPELNEEIAASVPTVKMAPFDCATLEVPLDHSNPNASELIELSLVKVNATKEPVLGSVLYNPGGPGTSGTETLGFTAEDLHLNIGGQFDLIAWDYRGTGKTLPFNCGLADALETSGPQRRDEVLPSTNLTELFLDVGWEFSVETAAACYAANSEIGRYIGTSSSAYDMVAIIDALDEDGLLRYYGYSYGTALGSYFAAMFPEKVDRMVLDANVNPTLYQMGTHAKLAAEIDKTFAAFIDECVANADACALVNATNATTSAEMFEVMDEFLLPITAEAASSLEVFSAYVEFKNTIQMGLYNPSRWPILAERLAAILLGEVEEEEENEDTDSSAPEPYNLGVDAIMGIRCSDATFQVSSAEEYLPTLAEQLNSTEGFGVIYSALWPCAAWNMSDVVQYQGDFRVKTRHPILLINGEYDSGTPAIGAFNASAGFEDSVVLIHDGYGHGIFPNPSDCVAEKIQSYFVDGDLPEEGTECEVNLGPWELAAYYAERNITRPY
ncbi:hypothetical protein B0A52_03092 [Exophiala mesophila]|uniref:AB hydrolase-1 domain-containing protein n=1 Tax=Exophiala mesophila TaxID=212818 RepID=A0A438NCU6_EXOME|nr:hypothetical protein B0A52_03092 [Exophiala mesophila]